jgi:hypothetical protein
MEPQRIGLSAAIATFFGVWFGYVAVRTIEYKLRKLWIPVTGDLILGVILETVLLLANQIMLSAITGILGVTLLWDKFELRRQQKRAIQGHAPANPDHLRHTTVLAKFSSATRLDYLNRDPVGNFVNPKEAIKLGSRSTP